MAPHSKEKQDLKFDPLKLQNMAEPLLVRVVKLKGSIQQPIELPVKEGQAPGAGWSRDEILSLENWLLNNWSGGGHYRCMVLDGNNKEMTWEFLFDPRLYPERVPPNAASAAIMGNPPTVGAAAAAQAAGPQPLPAGVQPLSQATGNANWPPQPNAFGYGTPPQSGVMLGPVNSQPAAPSLVAQSQPQQPTPWAQPQPMPQQTPWGGFQYGYQPYGQPPPPSPYTRTRDELRDRSRDEDSFTAKQRQREREAEEAAATRARELEAKLRAAEIQQKETEYKAQIERMQQQQAAQLQALQQQQAQQLQAMQAEMRQMAESRSKSEDGEVARLRQEMAAQREAAQQEMAKLQAQAQAQAHQAQQQLMERQLEQMRLNSEAQMVALREQIAQMANNSHKGDSDEVRMLRDQQERTRQELERQREQDRQERERDRQEAERERERERERFESQRRDEQLQRQMAEQRDAFERRVEQMMAAQNKGPDPMVEAIKEQARSSAEQMKEMSRMQQDQTNRLQSMMMNPMQLMQMVKESSSGNDGLMRNMVQSVEGIVQMYRGAAETVMQMSGGGGDSPTVRLLQEGLNGAKETAERFFSMKRDQAISEAKVKQAEAAAVAQRSQAEAHVQATAIQAQAQVQQAQAQAQWAPPPPVVQNGNGLNGAVVAPQRKSKAQAQPPVGEIPVLGNEPRPPRVEGVPADVPPAHQAAESAQLKLFGPAWQSVQQLRLGVANGNLTPSQTIDALLQGVQVMIEQNVVVPAFKMFDDQRFADLMDALLPDAPQPYKDECVQILVNEVDLEEPAEFHDQENGEAGDDSIDVDAQDAQQ